MAERGFGGDATGYSRNRRSWVFETIVFATDGSRTAERGLVVARRLADEHRARLIVLHVIEPEPDNRRGEATPGGVDDMVRYGAGIQVHDLRAGGIEAELLVVRSRPAGVAQTIADEARSLDADVIIAGARGQSIVSGAALGSVIEQLLATTPCPVLTIPPPSDLAAQNDLEVTPTGTMEQ
jgi:nucleotide-binding universal stress UspA family protein